MSKMREIRTIEGALSLLDEWVAAYRDLERESLAAYRELELKHMALELRYLIEQVERLHAEHAPEECPL